MKNESSSTSELVWMPETAVVVVVKRRDELMLCEIDTGNGWNFMELTRPD